MDNWKWVYGNLIGEDFITEDDFGEDYSPDYGPRDLRVFEVFAVAPLSIGQFTGLNDMDGKEIYEGDIIECGTRRFVCEFCEGSFAFRDISDGQLNLNAIANISHIIGNTYDNREMLKQWKN